MWINSFRLTRPMRVLRPIAMFVVLSFLLFVILSNRPSSRITSLEHIGRLSSSIESSPPAPGPVRSEPASAGLADGRFEQPAIPAIGTVAVGSSAHEPASRVSTRVPRSEQTLLNQQAGDGARGDRPEGRDVEDANDVSKEAAENPTGDDDRTTDPEDEITSVPLTAESVVRFATRDVGIATLTQRDEFVQSLSPFDRQVRLRSGETISEERFLEFVGAQVLEWREQEKAMVAARLREIAERLTEYRVSWPKTIQLIKTTGREEADAAYTRANAIVLPRRMLKGDPQSLDRLLLHELFHVHSRHDPAARDAAYALIGFRPCPPVRLPGRIEERRLTNPDAPVIRHCIELEVAGQKLTVAPVLFSNEYEYDPRSGGTLFRFLQFRLLVIDGEDAAAAKRVERGGVFLIPADMPDYFRQIGRNTGYIIHPDEILADNFVHLVMQTPNLRTPELIESLRKLYVAPDEPAESGETASVSNRESSDANSGSDSDTNAD